MKKYIIGLLIGGLMWWGIESGYNKPTPNKMTKINAHYHRIGLLSDIHGDKESVSYFLQRFKERKVDAIIVTGDIVNRSQWVFANTGEEIIRQFGQSGLPTYILPGNHDQRWYYEKAMGRQTKKYQNLHDLLQERRVDTEGIDFISNPSGNGKSYWFSGYYTTDYGELEQLLASFPHDDTLVLLTHQPPLCNGEYGIDYTLEKKNDGNAELDRIMRKYKIQFSFSGHIHSASGGCGEEEKFIPERVYSSTLRLNPGAVIKHRTKNGEKSSAAIVTLEGKKMMYELVERRGEYSHGGCDFNIP